MRCTNFAYFRYCIWPKKSNFGISQLKLINRIWLAIAKIIFANWKFSMPPNFKFKIQNQIQNYLIHCQIQTQNNFGIGHMYIWAKILNIILCILIRIIEEVHGYVKQCIESIMCQWLFRIDKGLFQKKIPNWLWIQDVFLMQVVNVESSKQQWSQLYNDLP